MRGDEAWILIPLSRQLLGTTKTDPGRPTISMMHGDWKAVKRTRKLFTFPEKLIGCP
jgi:hypothetical protein